MTDSSPSPTRRQVLAVAAATVTIPMLDTALGTVRSASAAAAQRGGTENGTNPAEKAGWFTTTLKAADLKDNEFTAVDGHAIVLSRAGKTVSALSNTCTHKGCSIAPKAGTKVLGPCQCHQAQFNLDGSVSKGPATTPLPHYAIRVNDKGLVEVDPGQTLKKDDKGASVTIS
jgi:Rieske Fe-S protein